MGTDTIENVSITELERFDGEWDPMQIPVVTDFTEDVLKEIEPIGTNRDAVEIGRNIINALHEEGQLS